MGHGFLGPWVNFGSTASATEIPPPPEWVKVVTTVAVNIVDTTKSYSETIVEPGQTDRSNKL